MSGINAYSQGTMGGMHRIFTDVSRAAPQQNNLAAETDGGSSTGKSFMDVLKESIGEVNDLQKTADTMATGIASGKSNNLHETMLASSQAELSFNLMVQIRNKALDAYQEIMRLPV